MPDYYVTLNVLVHNIDEDDDYFHNDTMDFLLETGAIENAEVQTITEF
jgi:hypothetical protein